MEETLIHINRPDQESSSSSIKKRKIEVLDCSNSAEEERPSQLPISFPNNSDAHADAKSGDQCESRSRSVPSAVLKDFKLEKVLRLDDKNKVICLHGSMPTSTTRSRSNEKDESSHQDDRSRSSAVVLLEKKSFDSTSIENYVQSAMANETLQNDIYSTYDMFSTGNRPDMKATVIFPATEKHVAKYSSQEPFIVHETPQLYKEVTLPCIEASKFSVQWVHNILAKKQEADRIVVEDPDPEVGFIMVPDMKWDREKVESLYLVAIVHKCGLKSLRDLSSRHLPLLRNVMEKGVKAIEEIYGVGTDKLRIYFHYQPSYYHLHIHFTHLQFDAPGSDVMRAHLLNDVIDNLTFDSDFYAKKTLSFVVRKEDNLHKWFSEKGYWK